MRHAKMRKRPYAIGPTRSGGRPFTKPNNSFHQNPIILAGQPCLKMSAHIFKNQNFQNCQPTPPRNGLKYHGGQKNVMPLWALLAVLLIVTRQSRIRPGPQGLLGSGGMNYWVFEKDVPRIWWAQLYMGVFCKWACVQCAQNEKCVEFPPPVRCSGRAFPETLSGAL